MGIGATEKAIPWLWAFDLLTEPDLGFSFRVHDERLEMEKSLVEGVQDLRPPTVGEAALCLMQGDSISHSVWAASHAHKLLQVRARSQRLPQVRGQSTDVCALGALDEDSE